MSSLKNFFYPPAQGVAIPPLASVKGWKQHPIEECGEPLVPLGAFSDHPQIFTDGVYFGERRGSSPYELGELDGALVTGFVRQGVAERLTRVAASLPPGYALMVEDSYRTIEVQKSLFEYQVHKLMREDGLDQEKAEEEAQRFVSKPSREPSRPSPHNTGGAVDLTIVKFSDAAWKKLQRLNDDLKSPDWKLVYSAEMQRQRLLRDESEAVPMGTMFDEVSDATPMRYFEDLAARRTLDPYEQECLGNRRMLYNAMTAAGFSVYDEEPWHYDFGNQFDAVKKGVPAIYGAAKLSPANVAHEAMRQGHLAGNLRERGDPRIRYEGRHPDAEIRNLVHETALATGDMARTNHPAAHKL